MSACNAKVGMKMTASLQPQERRGLRQLLFRVLQQLSLRRGFGPRD